MSTQEITESINALPFAQKVEVLHALEASLMAETQPSEEEVLATHLAIAGERLARLDAGIDKPIPWEEAMQRIFKKS